LYGLGRPGERIRVRGAAVLLSLMLMVLLAGSSGGAAAQDDAPVPQLPILLLNGAIYPQHYNDSALPADFRVGGYSADTTALYLVQCEGPIKESWVDGLTFIGAEIRGFVPYNALLVGMDGEARSRLGDLDFIRWSGLYQPYFKVSPALQLRLAQGGRVEVLAMIFSGRFLQDTLKALTELPVEVLGAEADDWCGVLAMRMPVEAVYRVASLPAVEWMELSTPGSLCAVTVEDNVGQRVTVEAPAQVTAGASRVAQGDTGLGTGGMQGVPAPLNQKVEGLFSFRGDDGRDVDGHGTAVAGVFSEAGMSAAAQAGFSPPCGLVAYATGYGLGSPPQPLSFYRFLENGREQGAGICFSGSVPEGKESLGGYGVYASQRDAFIWNNPSVAVVEAAGNEGTDSDGDGRVDRGSLLGGATAKNVLSLGGCESEAGGVEGETALSYRELEEVFSGEFPEAPLREDSSVGGAGGMAAFSSRGPTRDGRIKPDLVAPATDIPTVASGGAESAPGLYPSGTAGLVRAYGTSLAAAQAARYMHTLRGFLLSRGEKPSAALLKSFMVNGAVDLTPGQYGEEDMEVPEAPNIVEGWGRMTLDSVTLDSSWVKVLDDEEGMRLDESRVFKLEIPSGRELRVTLAWSDYPSLPEVRVHLVNDLDLRVIDPQGRSHYPNGRKSRDPLNNVERVVLDMTEMPGDYTLEISAWNVPLSPQPFALVVQVF